MQPITVWGHWGAPNPWKVRILLDELSLPYAFKILELSEAKGEEHLKVNPNGRLPTIEDKNTGVTLWETGAIMLYLIDTYDTENTLSYFTRPEKYLCQQWLAFQISGQGPYTGQATWFQRFHAEKLPSAINRYVEETERHISVLNLGLERSGTGWLVGDRCTYADLAFVTWCGIADGLFRELGKSEEVMAKYPQYTAWLERLRHREHVMKAMASIAEGRKAHGLT